MDFMVQVGLIIVSASIPVILAIFARLGKRIRPERELKLRLRSQASLPGIALGKKVDLLEIRWAGQPVDSLVVSRWNLSNSGTQPIRRQDFDDDLRIEFPQYNFLGSSVFRTDPPELTPRVRNALSMLKTKRGFGLKPLLWNPGDSVDFTVITEKPIESVDKIAVDARVVSGKVSLADDTATERVRTARQQRNVLLAMVYAGLTAALIAFILSIYYL